MFSVTRYKKIFYTISGTLAVISALLFLTVGLNLGIDFTGGSLLELRFESDEITHDAINSAYQAEIENIPTIQDTDTGVLIRSRDLSEDEHNTIVVSLQELFPEMFEEVRFESIGPSIGEELTQKSIRAIIYVLLAIVLYVAYAFRKISKPVHSWKYGITAIVVLFHDVIIVAGVFVLLGYFLGIEVDTPFIAAILTVLGYSVNDTIVVFDRVRENIHSKGKDFDEVIDASVRQSFSRSFNTSLTTMLVLLTILFFGGGSIQSFVLALTLGILVGTYSSLFLASPLLATWQNYKK